MNFARLMSDTAASTDQHQLSETLTKVFRQKRVDDWVETAVEVGQTSGGDLEHDQLYVIVSVYADVRLDEEGGVNGQPADTERDDDSRDHTHHSPTRCGGFWRCDKYFTGPSSNPTTTTDTTYQQHVQHADDCQWDGVADSEEGRIVDATVVLY